MKMIIRLLLIQLCSLLSQSSVLAQSPERFEFTRMIAHWARYADDDYLKFVEEARPELCQIGFHGGHFYALVHTPQFKGYPAHFPLQGIKECGQWQEKRTADIQKLGAKVVGHFNVTFLVGEPKSDNGPRGFFKFYQELWNEKELGPKPVKDPLALISKNVDGSPMSSKNYSIGKMREFTACLVNPHWQKVLQAWAKRGIERGVDGFQINYFYRHNCLCEHCQRAFRGYLKERFTAKQLRTKFKIDNLSSHKFTEIVGWHDPKKSSEFRREQLRWSQIACKQAFDNVFVKYARSLKPDLLLSQWNHLGNFNQIRGDERCMLPSKLWGKGEDYLWYSTGSAAFFTDLAEGNLGEGTLQARYIRGAFDDKPFTLGKYESTRTRVSIAELAANGGAPMGFYTRYQVPEARREIVRYYQFMAKHDHLFKANRPAHEVLLLYPRSEVHQGNVDTVDAFRKSGKELLNQHVLFDVLPDELLTSDIKSKYQKVLKFSDALSLPKNLSRFHAPTTVRVSASEPMTGGGITLHFVNYNRIEPEKKRSAGRGIQDEKPIAVKDIKVDFALPENVEVKQVKFLTPEIAKSIELKYDVKSQRLRFALPEFLVYGIAHIELK